MTESINGTVERLTEQMVVIKTENDEELFWPLKNLTAQPVIGAKVNLTLSMDSTGFAKETLNDILNVEPERNDRQL